MQKIGKDMQLYAENIMYAKKMKLNRLYMPKYKKFEVSAPTLGQSLNYFSSKVFVNTRKIQGCWQH